MGYDKMLAEFNAWQDKDKRVQALWKKVNDKTATYTDAKRYADLCGAEWSRILNRYCDNSAEANDLLAEIKKVLQKDYSQSAYYSKNVQKIVNDKAKIGMKVLEPRIDESRIDHLIMRLKEGAEEGEVITDATKFLIGAAVLQNIATSAVSDTVQANARIQSEAGLYSYVERDGHDCCEWCASMSGRYIYGEQPDGFFSVHKECTCTITFMPSKTKWQKITYKGGRKNTQYL